MYVHLSICIYMVYTCTYNVCTCLTFLNMYIHVKYMSIPFFQILSRWSGFQMMDDSLTHSLTLEQHQLDVAEVLEIFSHRQLFAKSSQ